MKKSWTSATNGVFCPSGARSIRQLQIKKVCLLKKMAERHRMGNSLPWKRNYDAPQVPPPSRSPSKTNIIWVRVRNSSGDMEIDGFLRTHKDFEDLLPEGKESVVPTKIDVKVPREQEGPRKDTRTTKNENTLKNEKDQLNENSIELEVVDSNFEQSRESKEEQKSGSIQASPSHTDVSVEDLVPTVKGLKVSQKEIRCDNHAKQKSDEASKNEVDERDQHSQTANVGKSTEDEKKLDVVNDRKTTDLRNESDLKRSRMHIKSRRENINTSLNIMSDLSSSISDWQNIRSVQKKNGNDPRSMRREIRQGNVKSTKGITNVIGNDKTSTEKNRKGIGKEQNTPTEGKHAKESKTKRQGNNVRESGESSSTKTRKGKSVQKSAKTNRNVQGMCIFAKTFITSESKEKTEKKTHENKKSCDKGRSKTRLHETKSAIKLPRKSCSACTVKTSAKNGSSLQVSGKKMRSESDTATCNKVRIALRESQSPVAIVLPSQSQLQNFDKVAKNKLRKTLAVQMRKHCYTGTWAFPVAQTRDEELEGMRRN